MTARTATHVTPPVTRTQIVRFAGAAGDFNPMHHDEPFAQSAGEETTFAMGQMTAAVLGGFVARWLGRDAIAAYGVRFKDKVRPGDVLVCTGELGDDGRAELSVAREADGVVVLTGWATTRGATA